MILLLIVLMAVATLIILAGIVIISPTIMGPFFQVLGDSGIGGTTANSAINVTGGLAFVALSGLSVVLAVWLYLKFGGRRRPAPRRRV